MKLEDLLTQIDKSCSKLAYFCSIHMLKKRFNIEEDSLDIDLLKDFFINYDNYEKLLNDYGSVIYNKFESSIDEVYNELCEFFEEIPDNRYLFAHRLKKILNQNPMKYLNIEDDDMKLEAIYRVEKKINIIEESLYYKENIELASKELVKLKKSVELVKSVVGIK